MLQISLSLFSTDFLSSYYVSCAIQPPLQHITLMFESNYVVEVERMGWREVFLEQSVENSCKLVQKKFVSTYASKNDEHVSSRGCLKAIYCMEMAFEAFHNRSRVGQNESQECEVNITAKKCKSHDSFASRG